MNETAIEVIPPPARIASAFDSAAAFADAQRMGTMLSKSKMIPDTYRDNLPDCVIAMEMANRIGANVLSVMQNLYIVHGRPAWSSQFLISCVNASGRFSPLRYRMTGEKGQDSYGCIAHASDRSGAVLEGPEVTVAMAKAEGWYQRNGSKWKTMPELMLRYRAATFFARLFAPELTMGIHTDEEVIDITPGVTETPMPAAARAVRGVSVRPTLSVVKEAPAEEPTAKPTPTETAEDAPQMGKLQADLAGFLTEAGVAFDDFAGWLKTTGRHEKADELDGFADVPDAVCEALSKDATGLTKCVRLYGKATK